MNEYFLIWHKPLANEATTLGDLIMLLKENVAKLEEMYELGITLAEQSINAAVLITTDPEVAKRFDMVKRS